jgi:hypothetical protein
MITTDPDALAASLIGPAMRLAGIVHDEGPDAGAELLKSLTGEQRQALPFILAAMIPVDKTAGELLGWVPGAVGQAAVPPARLRALTPVAPAVDLLGNRQRHSRRGAGGDFECGTPEGFRHHQRCREEPCDACTIAYRASDRTRHRDMRAARAAGPARPVDGQQREAVA